MFWYHSLKDNYRDSTVNTWKNTTDDDDDDDEDNGVGICQSA